MHPLARGIHAAESWRKLPHEMFRMSTLMSSLWSRILFAHRTSDYRRLQGLRAPLSVALLAGLAFSLSACSDDEDPTTVQPPPLCEGDECEQENKIHQCLAIATSEADEGALDILDLDELILHSDITTIHNDAFLTGNDEAIFSVNLYGADSLQKISQENYRTQFEYSLGTGSNPQMMAIHENRGFIPLYDKGALAVIDMEAADAASLIVEEIAIEPIADFDGSKSEPAYALIHDNVVYVAVQGIGDDWSCAEDGYSQIRAFDADTLAPAEVFAGEDRLNLHFCNALHMRILGDTLYVQSLGSYRAYTDDPQNDGGIEAINLASGEYVGVILDEADAGNRDIFQIYPAADGAGLWLTLPGSDNFNNIDVHHLDLSGEEAQLSPSVFTGYVWSLFDYNGTLFVSARDQNKDGIWMMNSGGKLLAEQPLMTSLPPRATHQFQRENGCL